MWKFELINIAKLSEEMRLVVKCLSNLELAGSPRNVLRRSYYNIYKKGKALFLLYYYKLIIFLY